MELWAMPSNIFWIGLVVSIICGSLIGLERQLRGKVLGIRTCVLICLGTQVFVRLGTGFEPNLADPTRVLGQVVTGIGFLGAGVILARGDLLTGVTSAATVWILAAIGATAGIGRFTEALCLSAAAMVMLLTVRLSEYIHNRTADKSSSSKSNALQ